ncbi:MAG: ferritin-like domain-containing protein [Thermoleophilia bacterium]
MTQPIAIAGGGARTGAPAAVERDRRSLLRRGFGLGGAAIAASSIPLLLSVRDAFAQATGDAAILEQAINLEQTAVIAYDGVLDAGLLSSDALRIARRLRDHERRHAETLTTALTDLGGIPPAPPEGVDAVDNVVEGLGDLKTQAEAVEFLIELELAGVAAYNDAHGKLLEGRLLQTAASITAAEGQHLVVLRMLLGTDPVPDAFETGAR